MNMPNFLSALICSLSMLGGCGGGGGSSAASSPSSSVQAALASPATAQVAEPCSVNSGSKINIFVKASRTSGVAPLSVIFDATETTGSARPFHDLVYSWNFGDATAGTWTKGVNNFLSKNQATGAVAGHVFETAGSHTVSLTVKNTADSSKCVAVVTVNVESPDTYVGFSGVKTACIANTLPVPGTNGCPSGSATFISDGTISSVDTVIRNALAAGSRRVLLQRGDSFTATGSVVANLTGPVMVGAFGVNTAKPVINMSLPGSYFINLSNAPTDWRFTNLDFNGQGTNVKFSATNGSNLSDHILYHQLTVRNAGGMNATRTNVAVVDSRIGPITGGSGNNGLWSSDAFGFFFAGNHINDTTAGEHGMRIQGARKGAVSHNTFTDAASTKQVFTLRGNDTAPYVTQYIMVSDNVFELTKLSADNWMTTISPQNSTRKEEIRDVIVERNLFRAVNGAQRALMISASDITLRNNLFNQSNISSSVGIFYDSVAGLSTPSNVKIYHNTFLSTSGENFSAITISAPTVSAIDIKNNLAYASAAYRDSSNNGSATFLNNMATAGTVISDSNTRNSDIATAPNLVDLNGDLVDPKNWALRSAILGDGSTIILGTEEDFLGDPRALTSSGGSQKMGIGAFRF